MSGEPMIPRDPECGAPCDQFEALAHDNARLRAEVARLREALTPSATTKAAYSGEFYVRFTERDENGSEYGRAVTIPWVAIKEIMASILARAALAQEEKS